MHLKRITPHEEKKTKGILTKVKSLDFESKASAILIFYSFIKVFFHHL